MVARPDGHFPDYQTCDDKGLGSRLVGGFRRCSQAGEASRDAVLREVKEETGLDASEERADICLHIKERIRVKEIITLWMCTVLSWMLMRMTCKLQTEETDGYMFATGCRSKRLQQKGNSCIMTVLRRRLSSKQISEWFSATDVKMMLFFVDLFLKTLFFALFSKNCIDIKR